MRIAVVFDNMRYGGIQRVGISHIKLLRELGYEVDAFILDANTETIIEELRVCVNKVKVFRFPRFLCPEYYYILVERYSLGKYLFPMVYFVILCINYFQKIIFRTRRKYDLAIAFSGHFNDLNFVARNFIKSKNKACWLHGAQYDYYLMSRGFTFLYAQIKNLVVLSNACDVSCKKIEERFGLKVSKLYNPVKLAEKVPDQDKVNRLKNDFGDYLLYVGRLATDKDPETIIKSIQYLAENHSVRRHLIIVGDGPKRSELQETVKKSKLTNWVHFEGIKEDVENYYCSAALFVHSSPLEGLPTTILEAMSYSLPVVATDSLPGVREILKDSEYGLICPVGDYESMANCILRIINNPDLYKHYQEAGLQRIKDFDPQVIKRQLSSIVDSWK